MVGLTKLDIETLVSETEKLLCVEINELYATLGAQLFVLAQPTSVARSMCYISRVANTCTGRHSHKGKRDRLLFIQSESGLALMHKKLKARGEQYVKEAKNELRAAICHEEILAWSDEINRSIIRILLTVVSGTLRTPRILDSISAVTVAIVLKLGLKNFCS